MEAFLSLIIFTFPGLVAFFWIQLFGVTPTVKYQGTEMLALCAILWIPINIMVLGVYNAFSLIYNCISQQNELFFIYDFETLNNLSSSFIFILYYVISSTLFSYLLARVITGQLYDHALDKINKIRKGNQRAPLSKYASVWDASFSKDIPQVIKIMKIDKEEPFDIGEIKNISRTYEEERNIVLIRTDIWRKIDALYDLDVEAEFFDIKAGIKIIVYNSEHCQETMNDYCRQ